MKNIIYYNAGAGSGKTYTLTHLLSDLLSKGTYKPSEVILTTFSELAAGEFRQRSFECLYSEGKTEIAKELDSATMGTVHSVALQFLRKYWYLIGISPDLKVISEDDFQVYVSQSLGEHITEEHLQMFNDYACYFEISDSNGHLNPDFWKKDLLSIIEKTNIYQLEVEESIKYNYELVDKVFSEKVSLDRDSLTKFRDCLNSDYQSYSPTPKSIAQNILMGLKNPETVPYSILSKIYKLFSSDGKEIGKGNYKHIVQIMGEEVRDRLMDNLGRFFLSSQDVDSPGVNMKVLIGTLFRIASDWKKNFEEFKKLHHIIDYNDMERLFLQLLKVPEVQQEIKGSYKLMLVDEFQDSNPVQLEIFQLMSEMMEQSYWVGDPKQSIYGFRGSNVSLVNELIAQFKEQGEANNLKLKRIDSSYRTRPALVQLVNRCFVRSFNGILDSKDVELTAKREENEGLIYPLYHWNCKAKNNEAFVAKVADRLKKLLDSQLSVLPKGSDSIRRIQPGDVALLCLTNEECKQFAKAFQKRGIPVTYKNDDFSMQTEIQLVITLLKFMVNASNKKIRAELLRFLDDQSTVDLLNDRLAYLNAKSDEEQDLWQEEHPLIVKLLNFRRMSGGLSVSDLTQRLVYGLWLFDVVCKWGEAEMRQQNLYTLCDLVVQYDNRCEQMGLGASISGFINYLSYVKIDVKIDNTANAVKILTYHGSKGLEWNYVILSSLEHNHLDTKVFSKKTFWGVNELRKWKRTGELSKDFILQYLPCIIKSSNTDLPMPVVDKCKELPSYKQLEEKERNELKHLLYVGMTRSRDYLTTLSRESTAKKALPPILEWIRNAGISSGDTCNQSNELWNYEDLLPAYEDITNLEEAKLEGDSIYQKMILPVGKLPTEGKYLSPSKLPIVQIEPENLEITARFERQIMVHETDHLMMDRIGTCIHNIFAVYYAQASHEENVVRATQIRDGYGLQGALPMVEQVICSIELLYQHLEQKYGKAESIKHEVPFIRPMDGQVMKGEMDLVWYLDKNTCVLVDFKNYPGKEESIMNPDNDHYVGVYASQLLAYRSVLEESGCKVLDTLVYYSVIGRIVKILV